MIFDSIGKINYLIDLTYSFFLNFNNNFIKIVVIGPLALEFFVTKDSKFSLILLGYLLEAIIFLKLFSLQTTFNRLERVVTENEKIASLFPLFSLCIKILALSHIVGLIYHG